MQTFIQPDVKLNIAILRNSNSYIKEKSNNSKSGFDFKFYQTLFVIILTSCAFLIFPEAPQDSEVLCRKYQTAEACVVW